MSHLLTEDDLKEHRADQKRREALLKKQRDKEEVEKQNRELAESSARYHEIFLAVEKEIYKRPDAANYNIKVALLNPKQVPGKISGVSLLINGKEMNDYVDMSEIYSGPTKWNRKPSGMYSVSIGDYRIGRKHFRPRKDKTYAFDKMAEHLVYLVDVNTSLDRKHAQEKINQAAERQVKLALGIPKDDWHIDATTDPDKPVEVEYSIKKHCTVDEAIKLVKALRACGAIEED